MKNPLKNINANELVEMRRLAVEMYKQGFLDGFILSKYKDGKLTEKEVKNIWDEIEKIVWKKFKKRFIHNKAQKGGKK